SSRDSVVDAPAARGAWPRSAHVREVAVATAFAPEPVAGRLPDGVPVVWGRGVGSGDFTTMQAWRASGAAWQLAVDPGRKLRPVGGADVNGDGAEDVLAQDIADGKTRAVWLVSRAPAAVPDSIAFVVDVDRVLGLFQLDDDPPFEALLSTGDSLFVYDDA